MLQVVDQLKDPAYNGDVQAMIFNVPLKTIDNKTEVSEHTKRKRAANGRSVTQGGEWRTDV